MASPIWFDNSLTFEQYLAFEESSPVRHEFVDGEVYAMSGANRRHAIIVSNIMRVLLPATDRGPCAVFTQSLKLRVGDDVYYPDVMVACSDTHTDDRWAVEPCLLIEVTSPSTARVDRREKLQAYRAIPSLKAYLIVEQAWRRVVMHWRDAAGEWRQQELHGDGAVSLPCPEITLTLGQMYEGLAPLTVREMEAIGYGVAYA
ncbi:MAG: Uma2 family endonuclease [Gemmatimonadota bacterium]